MNCTAQDLARPLTPRQRKCLDQVVRVARTGTPLFVACRNSGIRYETALRGLGLPTGGATVMTSDLIAAINRFEAREAEGKSQPERTGETAKKPRLGAMSRVAVRRFAEAFARASGHPVSVGLEAACSATTTARTDACDDGKWRRCELVAGHDGDHETTYCGRPFRWPNARHHDSSEAR